MLKPLSPGKWNSVTAAHLLNRAGFGGTPADIARLAGMGRDAAISLLLDYEKLPDATPAPDWARPDPDREKRFQALRQMSEEQRRQMQREEQQRQRQHIIELRAWWLKRMAWGPRPFQEKMALFWHGHFATSVQKVRDAYFMWRQNELFRRLATGNWLELLLEVAKDPAMLIWLDQAQSRKEHPNENFAREVMELFALGEGHYTEKDVTEAARALTGWSLDRREQEFVERPRWHDRGIKNFLGRSGNLDGKAVLEQIVAQPQAAIFITGKLWSFFAGEEPTPDLNRALADGFRRSDNHFKPLLRTMFLSEEFYGPRLIRTQVKSPVQWLVGSVRMLETELPPPQVSGNLLRSLGQELFAPPNVKGWDGGSAWINTNTLLARYNQTRILVDGYTSPAAGQSDANNLDSAGSSRQLKRFRSGGVNADKVLTKEESADRESVIAALQKRLLQARLKGKREQALHEYLEARGTLHEADVRGAIRLVMCTPEFQLA